MKSILFVGNSFTFFNDLPGMVRTMAAAAGMELLTDSVTRGGAYLHQFIDPADPISAQLEEKYRERPWDIIVLQDQSINPALEREDFLSAVAALKAKMIANDAFCFYQTWAYAEGSQHLEKYGITYDEMWRRLRDAYEEAAEQSEGVCVPVGDAFLTSTIRCPELSVYGEDGKHPSVAGTYLAACLFLKLLTGQTPLMFPGTDGLDEEAAEKLRGIASEF